MVLNNNIVCGGVVGITPNLGNSLVLPGTAAVWTNPIMTFVTKAGSNIRLSGVGFYGINNSLINTNFTISDGSILKTGSLSINEDTNGEELSITWLNGFNGYLTAGKTYSLQFNSGTFPSMIPTFKSIGTLTNAEYLISNTDITAATAKAYNAAAVNLYFGATAVPEPSTLILTGLTLILGVIGCTLSSRRKRLTKAIA